MARNFGDWDNVVVNTSNDSMQMNLGDKTVLNLSSSMTATVSFLSCSQRLYSPGGFVDSFTFYKSFLVSSETCAMTASTIQSGSSNYKVYLKTPMVRGGSILGLALLSEQSNIQAGAISASVTVDGVNITTNATGSWLILSASGQQQAAILYTPFVYTFSGTQALGVTLTASSTYVTGSVGGGVGGHWSATVLVEI